MKTALRSAIPISGRRITALVRGTAKVRTKIQNEQGTYQAGIAAMLGMSNKTIASMTGYSLGQVSYRLVHTGASQSRQNYRNGQGPVAEFLLRTARPFAEKQFVELMREKLNLQSP